MHSARFSILASSPDAKMYEFHLEIPELLAVDNIIDDIAPNSVTLVGPEQLKKYLESPEQHRWVIGMFVLIDGTELDPIRGTQVGPFHLAQIQPRKDLIVLKSACVWTSKVFYVDRTLLSAPNQCWSVHLCTSYLSWSKYRHTVRFRVRVSKCNRFSVWKASGTPCRANSAC